ncbi:RINGv [Musa troglodytarum]|uniref:RINGv n=1 Tax=Musa troglodytarum TaxID=320322 RepID=A0A9E7GUR5_9LILI|nr:RINGv [Musa troglodytarum]URE21706.1 RINGv [Musa troglodytarum]
MDVSSGLFLLLLCSAALLYSSTPPLPSPPLPFPNPTPLLYSFVVPAIRGSLRPPLLRLLIDSYIHRPLFDPKRLKPLHHLNVNGSHIDKS